MAKQDTNVISKPRLPHDISTYAIASISQLKKDPMALVAAGNGRTVVILKRNKPAFYCVPATIYENMMDRLEDIELNAIADARAHETPIRVRLDSL